MLTGNNMNKKLKSTLILTYIILSIGIFATMLIVPSFREVFKKLSTDIPYIMGFIKFALFRITCNVAGQGVEINNELWQRLRKKTH